MITLGVETSALTSVALRSHGELLAERTIEPSRQKHAQTLVQESQQILAQHHLTAHDVDLLAVSHGPGSFTGLRVGIVFGKTFAFATGCRLAAVDTLQAVAQASPADVDDVLVVVDAQREQLFHGHFRRQNDGWFQRQATIDIIDNAEFLSRVASAGSGGPALSGPGLRKLSAAPLPQNVRVLPSELWFPRAALIAALGEQMLITGPPADPFLLEPFYLRASSAEEKRDVLRQTSSSASAHSATSG